MSYGELFEYAAAGEHHPEPEVGAGQRADILHHLQARGSITALEALDRFGCLRLAARIGELRELGYDIETTYPEGAGKRYAIYTLT